ncbi:class A beta-lactamase [Frondihabitans sp. Leaf304]|uniref:class A beta-lactamase n=1 Tax=Frondihabitans sp. Leaf304 TaxID=1736329 RepID=UPI000A079FD8|nr:class A beta-lactamase [Frondihabitans sp. Leaf304]
MRRRGSAIAASALVAAVLLTGCTAGGQGGSGTEPASVSASAPDAAGTTAPSPTTTPATTTQSTRAEFSALENKYGARLGVFAVDTSAPSGSEKTIAYRPGERFAFASTYKALAAGILFKQSTEDELDHTIHFTESDLVDYSPVTEKHVASGMTVREIIAAALQYSDNTAANLMLDQLGGPAGLTESLRSLGDTTTSVDRPEPGVNEAIPKDPRDTTTPAAIAGDLRSFLLGGALAAPRRAEMTTLMLGNTTGAPWIRAGVPSTWKIADKTGNASYGTRNDIAVAYPPGRAPIVIALLSDRGTVDATSDDGLLADATRIVVGALE